MGTGAGSLIWLVHMRGQASTRRRRSFTSARRSSRPRSASRRPTGRSRCTRLERRMRPCARCGALLAFRAISRRYMCSCSAGAGSVCRCHLRGALDARGHRESLKLPSGCPACLHPACMRHLSWRLQAELRWQGRCDAGRCCDATRTFLTRGRRWRRRSGSWGSWNGQRATGIGSRTPGTLCTLNRTPNSRRKGVMQRLGFRVAG